MDSVVRNMSLNCTHKIVNENNNIASHEISEAKQKMNKEGGRGETEILE